MSRKQESAQEQPAAEWVELSALTPWEKNPRLNDAAVDKVAASIQAFGFGAPIVARRENGEVIAGHTRLKAAAKLGLATVPVRFLDITAEQAHQLALADNKLGEVADWDNDALALLLQDAGEDAAALAGWSAEDVSMLTIQADELSPDEGIDLPSGDRAPYRQVTFTLHDEQYQLVQTAMAAAKEAGADDPLNENSNGNAIAAVCRVYLDGLRG